MFRSCLLGLTLGAVGLLTLASVRGQEGGADAPGPQLTAADRTAVRQLAEQALQQRGLLKGKVVLTRIEVFQDSRDRASGSNALVTHYCYEGDLTIFSSVNVGRGEVTKVETLPHFPAPLAPEEWARADKLARAHPEVKKALARHGDGVEIDALVTYTTVESSPSYNHRVVKFFFRRGREYLLYGPGVEVDLTTEAVRVERIDQGHDTIPNRPQPKE